MKIFSPILWVPLVFLIGILKHKIFNFDDTECILLLLHLNLASFTDVLLINRNFYFFAINNGTIKKSYAIHLHTYSKPIHSKNQRSGYKIENFFQKLLKNSAVSTDKMAHVFLLDIFLGSSKIIFKTFLKGKYE